MFKRILCPIDFDEGNSLAALKMARDIAEEHNAKIDLLHVVPPVDPTVMSAPLIAEKKGNRARAELSRISEAELRGIDHEILLRFGHPAKEILAAVEATSPDVVVIATHGRTGVAHLFLGSVAEKVVRESPCPVLTVRTDKAHKPARPVEVTAASRHT